MIFDPKEVDRVQAALDDCLSGLDQVPSRRAEILARAKGEPKVKKKLSAGIVLAIVMALMMSVAVAATLGLFGRLTDQDEDTRLGVLDSVSAAVGMSYEVAEGVTLTVDQAYYDGSRVFLSYAITGPRATVELGEGKPDIVNWDRIEQGYRLSPSAFEDSAGKQVAQWLDAEEPRWARQVTIGTHDGVELADGTYCDIIGGTHYEQEDGSAIGWKECVVPEEAAKDEITVCIGVYQSDTTYYQQGDTLCTSYGSSKAVYYPVTVKKSTAIPMTGSGAGPDWSATASVSLSAVDLKGEVTVSCPESWTNYWFYGVSPDAPAAEKPLAMITDWTLYVNGQPVDGFNLDGWSGGQTPGVITYGFCWQVSDPEAEYTLVPIVAGEGEKSELGIKLSK